MRETSRQQNCRRSILKYPGKQNRPSMTVRPSNESASTTYAESVLKSLQEFLRLEAAGGLLLMAATVLAMVVANSPLYPYYAALLDIPFEISVGAFGIGKPLLLWINDGLMAIFFLVVGMELKREVI